MSFAHTIICAIYAYGAWYADGAGYASRHVQNTYAGCAVYHADVSHYVRDVCYVHVIKLYTFTRV